MPSPRSTTLATARGLVRVTSAPEPRRAAAKREPAHQTFLADHWDQLAAAAYGGFREHGAGAVVLWRDDKPRFWRPRPFEPERLWFATQAHVIPGASRVDFDGWEAELIETYDPEREAIVVFVEGGTIAGYLVSGTLPPPEAHVAVGARLN
ncbi:hypothetical protein [Rubricoccus marinus]|uniref:Uncharacterized protein n=1 Tax=Rubricoccus marinus TaxID=716817 RepID=A0A259TYT6_9BACT|nr:hypothetical protein [Rubricoccus marinus]OZC02933.1 hypothetical protein BSZ36_08075 [Rubricoccus marinus]